MILGYALSGKTARKTALTEKLICNIGNCVHGCNEGFVLASNWYQFDTPKGIKVCTFSPARIASSIVVSILVETRAWFEGNAGMCFGDSERCGRNSE